MTKAMFAVTWVMIGCVGLYKILDEIPDGDWYPANLWLRRILACGFLGCSGFLLFKVFVSGT